MEEERRGAIAEEMGREKEGAMAILTF